MTFAASLRLMVSSAGKQRVSNAASRVYPTCVLKVPISDKPEIGGLALRDASLCDAPQDEAERGFARTWLLLPLQQRQQRRGIPALAAHALHLRVELIDQRGDREPRAVLARFAEAN
jgi:hypothetical protein